MRDVAENLWCSLRVPFSGHALWMFVFSSVLFAISAEAGMLGLWLLILVAGFSIRYLTDLARAALMGEPEPPPLTTRDLNPVGPRQIQLAIVMGGPVTAALLLDRFGHPVASAVVWALTLSLFPAAALNVSLDSGFLAAINPFASLAMGWKLGPAYLAPVGLLTGGYLALAFLPIPAWAVFPVLFYLAMVVVHATGRAAHPRHSELGLLAVEDRIEERVRRERQRDWAAVMDEAHRLLGSGHSDQARAMLHTLADGAAEPQRAEALVLAEAAGWRPPAMLDHWIRDRLSGYAQRGDAAACCRFLGRCVDAARRPDLDAHPDGAVLRGMVATAATPALRVALGQEPA